MVEWVVQWGMQWVVEWGVQWGGAVGGAVLLSPPGFSRILRVPPTVQSAVKRPEDAQQLSGCFFLSSKCCVQCVQGVFFLSSKCWGSDTLQPDWNESDVTLMFLQEGVSADCTLLDVSLPFFVCSFSWGLWAGGRVGG